MQVIFTSRTRLCHLQVTGNYRKKQRRPSPSILEAAVIGVLDEDWREAVKAFVLLKEGEKASGQEIIDLCKKNLASYKKPKSVEFLDILPRNPAGKVLKKQLREKSWKGQDRIVS
ncbi:MAG: hypothetical protein ABID54_13000 [Pseudomonadota bacterium]